MTTSTKKSCKNLRPRDLIRLKYVIPPATVVNQKSGVVPQGVDTPHFTFPVSVTSIKIVSLHRLEAVDFRAGPRERACGVPRKKLRKLFELSKAFEKFSGMSLARLCQFQQSAGVQE